MLDILQKLGLPINASVHGGAVDEVISMFHWLMLFLFVGWGIFFLYTLCFFWVFILMFYYFVKYYTHQLICRS